MADPVARAAGADRGRARQLSAKQARANAEKYGRRFDSQQKEPWYRYQRDGGWVQGWYEDDEAFAAKLELAREQQIGGVCLWVLDGANDPHPFSTSPEST